MYNYVGQNYKTAKGVREVMRTQYTNTFDGLSGNEDVGQMSAWYILSAMGMYQVDPADGRYWLALLVQQSRCKTWAMAKHSPSLHITIAIKTFYIKGIKLNGKTSKNW